MSQQQHGPPECNEGGEREARYVFVFDRKPQDQRLNTDNTIVETIDKLLARNVREKREALGISMGELSRRSGLSWSAVQRIENALRWPTPDTIEAIAKALGVPTASLFSSIPLIAKPSPRDALHVLAELVRESEKKKR